MPPPHDPSPAVAEAFRLIQADPNVQILEPLQGIPGGEVGSGRFVCSLPVNPQPNAERLPSRARLRVEMSATFPLSEVEVFAEEAEFRGFPHQDAETGKLCLKEERQSPWDVGRLGTYLAWAEEWLSDAATDQLLAPGDRFELPDFSRHKRLRPLPTDLPVFFDETAETFPAWADMVGQSGRVEFYLGRVTRGLLTRVFRHESGIVRERVYADGVFNPPKPGMGMRIFGRWILLPDLRFHRQRPAQTFEELDLLCRRTGIDLGWELTAAWDEKNKKPWASILLVGQPIPVRVDGEPTEVHWQPLLFESQREDRRTLKPKFGKMKRGAILNQLMRERRFAPGASLPWGKSVNIARERMYARGAIPRFLQPKKIVVAGCGALGAPVAEILTRAGAEDVALFDPDSFEMGNQCRHTLDGSDLGNGKAEALAVRLLSSNPLSNIRGFTAGLPLSPDKDHRPKDSLEAITNAELLIDCTTDDGAFFWLNNIAKRSKGRVATIFVNFRADVLTLCVAGKHTPCLKVCEQLYQDVQGRHTPVPPEQYDRQPSGNELLVPGAGCWHPTFPARITHMWMLASAAIEVLLAILEEPFKTEGTGVLLRRNCVGPLIETVWRKRY